MDRKDQRANEDVHVREVNDRELSAAIAAMCDDFGHHISRERTRSWVSSAVSSVAHSGPAEQSIDHAADELEDYVIVDSVPSGEADRKQQVRLTTINPVTGIVTDGTCNAAQGQQPLNNHNQ
ncbi:hypothetical protein EV175_006482, partial [Coemansia sp. RSA 1933]